jgi:hypothetical protein
MEDRLVTKADRVMTEAFVIDPCLEELLPPGPAWDRQRFELHDSMLRKIRGNGTMGSTIAVDPFADRGACA